MPGGTKMVSLAHALKKLKDSGKYEEAMKKRLSEESQSGSDFEESEKFCFDDGDQWDKWDDDDDDEKRPIRFKEKKFTRRKEKERTLQRRKQRERKETYLSNEDEEW